MAYQSEFSSVVPRRMQIYNIKMAAYQVKLLTLAKIILLVLGASMLSLKFGKALQLTALIIPCVDWKYCCKPLWFPVSIYVIEKRGLWSEQSGRILADSRRQGWITYYVCPSLTWDQALFSFRFENYIPAGKAKQKESLIQTFNEMSAAHFFDWLTFAKSANQNYFRCLFF